MKDKNIFFLIGLAIIILVIATFFFFKNKGPLLPILGSDTNASSTTSSLKPVLQGLISMGDQSFRNTNSIPNNSLNDIYARPGIFGGVVINATWSQLEPQQGALDSTSIDQALANVRTYNQKYPTTPLAVRLRISPGNDAPDWVKNLEGPPITVSHNGTPITIGRFWSESYRQAWAQLQSMLAAKYDSEPLIREVGNSSCSTLTDEPFIVPLEKDNLSALHNAGFTDALYENCLLTSGSDYQDWHTTRVEFPFNQFHLTDSLPLGLDPTFSIQVMDAWRNQLGARGVIGNHSLQSPLPTSLTSIYSEIQKLGSPIAFQLASPSKTNTAASISYGVSQGANSIEVWDGSFPGGAFTTFDTTTLKQWADEINKNKI